MEGIYVGSQARARYDLHMSQCTSYVHTKYTHLSTFKIKTHGFPMSNEMNTVVMSITVFTEEKGQSWLPLGACLWLLQIKKGLHVAGQEYQNGTK